MPKYEYLPGHVSPETAYVVDDYPYGFRLRCKIRYWIERAASGAKKGEYRMVSQTTNPKRNNIWNKPNAGTYSPFEILVKDIDTGHIHSHALNVWCKPDQLQNFREIMGDKIEEDMRKMLHALEGVLRNRYAADWAAFDAKTKPEFIASEPTF